MRASELCGCFSEVLVVMLTLTQQLFTGTVTILFSKTCTNRHYRTFLRCLSLQGLFYSLFMLVTAEDTLGTLEITPFAIPFSCKVNPYLSATTPDICNHITAGYLFLYPVDKNIRSLFLSQLLIDVNIVLVA